MAQKQRGNDDENRSCESTCDVVFQIFLEPREGFLFRQKKGEPDEVSAHAKDEGVRGKCHRKGGRYLAKRIAKKCAMGNALREEAAYL
jgi:hypothetical protein